MCGIVGIFMPRGRSAPAFDLNGAMAIMRHRGPDGDGAFESPRGDYRAGFRRLAIIDLETGDQPLQDDGGKRVLVGNGEIYNYVELRRRFAAYPYRTDGDMETVLAVRRAEGPDYVHALNGMYAFALYDGEAHTLELVRDRLGVKPLYWAAVAGGGITFASEIKALFASGMVEPAIDEAAANAYLAHGFVPGPATLFHGVYKLMPGERMIVADDGTKTVETYWRPAPAHDLPQGRAAAGERLIELLRDSVRLQLRSDVPVGALLSGGIDSGMIVALAAEHSSDAVRTFTVRFEDAHVDETPLAAEVAARYATEHETIEVAAGDATEHLLKLAWYSEEPLNDAAMLPNFLIERALADHVRVALSGTGGDELFAGYGRYFPLPVERSYLCLPGFVRRRLIEPVVGMASPMRAWQLSRAEMFEHDRGAYLHAHSTHFPAPIRDIIGNRMVPPAPAQAACYQRFMETGDREAQAGALAADIGTYLVDDLLTLLDRSAMAVSVEGRVPFLDHRLVEAALAVPENIRTPGGRQKGLLRDLARDFLPTTLIDAPKHGFVSPVPGWMRGDLGAAARRLLTAPRALERGWWRKDGVERLLAEPDRHGYRIYTLMALELAVRLFTETPLDAGPPAASLNDFADG